jgi:DNA-binding MarR family transcriptional regulator
MTRPEPYSLLFDLFVANQKVRSLLATALADAQLRPDEYAVYSVLFENGPTGPSELARLLGMPATTISGYARTMQSRKHAVRQPLAADGRAYQLALTPAGLAAHAGASAIFRTVAQQIDEYLSQLGSSPAAVRRSVRRVGDAAELTERQLYGLATAAASPPQAPAGR